MLPKLLFLLLVWIDSYLSAVLIGSHSLEVIEKHEGSSKRESRNLPTAAFEDCVPGDS